MKIKVHWIVDGIAELDANNQEEAEKWVNEVLTQILNDNPIFSEKKSFDVSFSSKYSKSKFIPIFKLGKHISISVVINPPEPISCPEDIFLS